MSISTTTETMSMSMTTETMSENINQSTLHNSPMLFPFFSLPAELRNEIYNCLVDFHPVLNFRYRNDASEAESTDDVPLPLHALCASSTQLRTEFYPIWMSATQHVVPLKYTQKYLATFQRGSKYRFPDGTFQARISAIPPLHRNLIVTLSKDRLYSRSIGIYVDILPIIKLKIASPSSDIKFALGLRLTGAATQMYSTRVCAGAESERLGKILRNRNKLWLQLIEHGIGGVEIDNWGMVARVKMEKNAVGELMGHDWEMELANDRRGFEERLGLEGLRCVFVVVKD